MATSDVPCLCARSPRGGDWRLREPRSHLLLSVPRSHVLLLALPAKRGGGRAAPRAGDPRPPPRPRGSPLQAGLAAGALLPVALLAAGGLAQLPLPALRLQPLALLLRAPLLLQPAVLLLLLRGGERAQPARPSLTRGSLTPRASALAGTPALGAPCEGRCPAPATTMARWPPAVVPASPATLTSALAQKLSLPTLLISDTALVFWYTEPCGDRGSTARPSGAYSAGENYEGGTWQR